MSFHETLAKHLQAIQGRDLQALADTLPADELMLITSDGRLVRGVREFLEMHRGWFAGKTWTLGAEVVHTRATPDMGLAVVRLDYRDTPEGRPPIREASYLTLGFERRDGKWVMVHDQNTPVKAPPA